MFVLYVSGGCNKWLHLELKQIPASRKLCSWRWVSQGGEAPHVWWTLLGDWWPGWCKQRWDHLTTTWPWPQTDLATSTPCLREKRQNDKNNRTSSSCEWQENKLFLEKRSAEAEALGGYQIFWSQLFKLWGLDDQLWLTLSGFLNWGRVFKWVFEQSPLSLVFRAATNHYISIIIFWLIVLLMKSQKVVKNVCFHFPF